MKTNHTKDEQSDVRGIDLVSEYVEKAMFIKSRELDEQQFPFIKKLTDEEYTSFRDIVRNTLQHLQAQHEAEKRELVEDIRLLIAKHGRSEDFNVEGLVNDINARHGLSTKD